MKKYFRYLSYVIRHKWYVFLECCKAGIVWQGIIHDLSKLKPSEFFPYANYFYGNSKSTYITDATFDFAWLLHQKRNKHHWQWWVLPKDDGDTKIFDMPLKYRKEMLCDWIGAGKAITGKNNIEEWYKKNKNKMLLHTNTKEWIEKNI